MRSRKNPQYLHRVAEEVSEQCRPTLSLDEGYFLEGFRHGNEVVGDEHFEEIA